MPYLDPYERLLFAVLGQVWADAHGRNGLERYQALAWLRSGDAEWLCDWLSLPVADLRRRVSDNIGHKKES